MCQHATTTADLPNTADQIKFLKYIGPRFARRFRDEGIRTMQALIDQVRKQTRDQNTQQWRRIFENARTANNTQCVDHNNRRPTRPWQTAWPQDRQPVNPNGIPLNQQNDLDQLQARYYPRAPGQYRYCVRSYNKCAWESAIDYLLRKGPRSRNFKARIPLSIERAHWCRTATVPWCLVPDASASSSSSSKSLSQKQPSYEQNAVLLNSSAALGSLTADGRVPLNASVPSGQQNPAVRRRPTRTVVRKSSSSNERRSGQDEVLVHTSKQAALTDDEGGFDFNFSEVAPVEAHQSNQAPRRRIKLSSPNGQKSQLKKKRTRSTVVHSSAQNALSGSPDGQDNDNRGIEPSSRKRVVPVQATQISSSWDPSRPERTVREVWTKQGRKSYLKKYPKKRGRKSSLKKYPKKQRIKRRIPSKPPFR